MKKQIMNVDYETTYKNGQIDPVVERYNMVHQHSWPYVYNNCNRVANQNGTDVSDKSNENIFDQSRGQLQLHVFHWYADWWLDR